MEKQNSGDILNRDFHKQNTNLRLHMVKYKISKNVRAHYWNQVGFLKTLGASEHTADLNWRCVAVTTGPAALVAINTFACTGKASWGRDGRYREVDMNSEGHWLPLHLDVSHQQYECLYKCKLCSFSECGWYLKESPAGVLRSTWGRSCTSLYW